MLSVVRSLRGDVNPSAARVVRAPMGCRAEGAVSGGRCVASEMRSPADGPTIVAPRILSSPLTHEILTKPRVTPSHLQRSTASSGRVYVSYAVPAASSSFS